MVFPLNGQSIPDGSLELIPELRPQALQLDKSPQGRVESYRGREGETVLRLVTEQRPANIYALSRSIPLDGVSLKEGQTLLVSFMAKTEEASLETGEGKLRLLLRQSVRHQDNLKRTVSIGNRWRRYYFPLQLSRTVAAGELGLALQFGYPKQVVKVRELRLQAFGPEVILADLPRTRLTYAGRADTAGWRPAAEQRIRRHRTGSFSLRFTDGAGEVKNGVAVSVQQLSHDFGWGAAVNAQAIVREPERLNQISRAFNTVVFENDLKIKRWQKPDFRRNTLAVMDSFARRGVAVKGHVLVWPGFNYLPARVKNLAGKPAAVTRFMQQHVADILRATRGKVSHWDVVNEAYSNRDLQQITGSEEILYNAYRQTATLDPGVGRFTNEFGIISRGGHDEQKQQWYYDYIRRIDEKTNGLVDGIGIQCHMGSDLTPPEQVLELLNYYAELGKKISISEFTIDLDDPELRFAYTRDFMTIAFSHPAVSEFLFWGHRAATHPKAAIFAQDGSPADMGAAFFALVHDKWRTEINATTDDGGRVQGNGFFGAYRYTYQIDGKEYQGQFQLEKGKPLLLEVVVAE